MSQVRSKEQGNLEMYKVNFLVLRNSLCLMLKKKGSHRCQDEGMDLLILLDNRKLDGQVLFTYMNNKLLQAKAAQVLFLEVWKEKGSTKSGIQSPEFHLIPVLFT